MVRKETSWRATPGQSGTENHYCRAKKWQERHRASLFREGADARVSTEHQYCRAGCAEVGPGSGVFGGYPIRKPCPLPAQRAVNKP